MVTGGAATGEDVSPALWGAADEAVAGEAALGVVSVRSDSSMTMSPGEPGDSGRTAGGAGAIGAGASWSSILAFFLSSTFAGASSALRF